MELLTTTDNMIDKMVGFGRVHISFDTISGRYKADIWSLEAEKEGVLTPCEGLGATLNLAVTNLYQKMKSSDCLLYGKYTSQEKRFYFDGMESEEFPKTDKFSKESL